MAESIESYFDNHAAVARQTAMLWPQIEEVGRLICEAFETGHKLLTFGNGGSACDAMHLSQEMIGRFKRIRRPLAAICLNTDSTAMTCIANDFSFADIFARQVTGLAARGDLVVGISTSGNSENVLRGLAAARQGGAVSVALLGNSGGKIAAEVDHAIVVPSSVTSHIQEMHICIIHLLCEAVDRWAAGETA